MKVLLYLEGKAVLEKSGIGRALQHQMKALDLAGIPYTTDPSGDYDVVHINTYGPRSLRLLHKAKKQGKKVIMHGQIFVILLLGQIFLPLLLVSI